MRIFVTGATGFVGSHLVEHLLAAGHDVAALARNPEKARTLFPDRSIRWATGDLTNATALRDGLDGTDVVFHVAGLTAGTSRAELYAVNAEGTRRVVNAARAVAPGIQRFVYVSSLAAAGPTPRGHLRTDADPTAPVSDYGASKLAGERETARATFPWTIVRPAAVYGPRDAEFLRVFRLARRGVLPRLGDGAQEVSLIHVSDLVRALVAVTAAECAGHVHCAAHPEIVTEHELALAIHAAVRATAIAPDRMRARPRVIPIPAPLARAALTAVGVAAGIAGRRTLLSRDKAKELLAPAWVCSTAELERHTGWEASVALPDGLAETARWYRAHGWL